VTPDLLALIYGHTERVIAACEEALADQLITEDEGDSAEARAALTRAMNAAVLLRKHLDENFDFTNGQAEPKEVDIATN
jgi:hypothetical protein